MLTSSQVNSRSILFGKRMRSVTINLNGLSNYLILIWKIEHKKTAGLMTTNKTGSTHLEVEFFNAKIYFNSIIFLVID